MLLNDYVITKPKSYKNKTDGNGNVNIKEFKKWLTSQSTCYPKKISTHVNINYIIENLKRWEYKERTK